MQGQQSIIFIKEHNVFTPVEIKTGAVNNELVQVLSDISNRNIAANAWYLVDSEGFIKVNQSIQ